MATKNQTTQQKINHYPKFQPRPDDGSQQLFRKRDISPGSCGFGLSSKMLTPSVHLAPGPANHGREAWEIGESRLGHNNFRAPNLHGKIDFGLILTYSYLSALADSLELHQIQVNLPSFRPKSYRTRGFNSQRRQSKVYGLSNLLKAAIGILQRRKTPNEKRHNQDNQPLHAHTVRSTICNPDKPDLQGGEGLNQKPCEIESESSEACHGPWPVDEGMQLTSRSVKSNTPDEDMPAATSIRSLRPFQFD
ncbi:hypothetical protein DFH06DRAFT_1425668 [Mycena polygramma]|nr:hypothetical protein DFH06DRAFT_1425668 [Mycena polygramma]